MKVLIDADILVYRNAWAVQKTHYTHKETGEFFDGKAKASEWLIELYGGPVSKGKRNWLKEHWKDEEWEAVEEIEEWKACRFLLDHSIDKIKTNVGATDFALYLSPDRCFRHDIATVLPYKGKRRPAPFYKDKAREHFINYYAAVVGENIEADDLCGLNQTTETIIASIDKDLLSIPGHHYNIDSEEQVVIDLYEADQMFFCQLLAGDLGVDNIPGLPGIGMATAQTILSQFDADHEGLVKEIKSRYEEAYPGQGEKIMIEMAQLVYILRRGDTPGKEQWRSLLGV